MIGWVISQKNYKDLMTKKNKKRNPGEGETGQKKSVSRGKKRKGKRGRTLLGMAQAQRLGYDYETIAEADKNSGIKSNLFDYLSKHPKLRDSYDRGRLLRVLVRTAPNSMIYEAATKLKNLGFNQFKTGQDLRDFLDKDAEANEMWETARVNAAIKNREDLRNAAAGGNVKAIELLDKWTIDRRKETGETFTGFNRIGVNQMAELFRVSRTTVWDWATQKGLPKNIDGSFDLSAAIQWFEKYSIQKVTTKTGPVTLNPLQSVKAENAKLELQEKKGELTKREKYIGWRLLILKSLKGKMDDIISVSNLLYGQPREEIANILEKYRDELFKCIRDVPAELKLPKEAMQKLNELYEIIGPVKSVDKSTGA